MASKYTRMTKPGGQAAPLTEEPKDLLKEYGTTAAENSPPVGTGDEEILPAPSLEEGEESFGIQSKNTGETEPSLAGVALGETPAEEPEGTGTVPESDLSGDAPMEDSANGQPDVPDRQEPPADAAGPVGVPEPEEQPPREETDIPIMEDEPSAPKHAGKTKKPPKQRTKTPKKMGGKPVSSPAEKTQKKGILIGSAVALIFSILLFALLTLAEDAVMNRRATRDVYVYADNYKEGTQLTASNVAVMTGVDASAVPDDAATELSQIEGMYIKSGQSYKGMICLSQLSPIRDEVSGSRTLGITFNVAGAVNGLIRASDHIDLYVIYNGTSGSYYDTSSSEFGPYLEHVFVNKVFVGGSTQIPNDDTASFAAGIEITVPEDIADDLIEKISKGASVWATKCED